MVLWQKDGAIGQFWKEGKSNILLLYKLVSLRPAGWEQRNRNILINDTIHKGQLTCWHWYEAF